MLRTLAGAVLFPASVGLLLAASPFLFAQDEAGASEDPAAAESVFFETLDVNVVNVEVFVTDRDGNPVTGLTRDDFTLFEDGRPVTITNFYAVDGGTPSPATTPLPSEAANEGTASDTPRPLPELSDPAARIPEEQRLYLVLYFDNLYLRPFSRNRVAREVRSFLSQHVNPDDRVMVVTFERSLHVRQPFTSDLGAVRDALFAIEELSGFAVQAAEERSRVIRSLDSSRSFADGEPLVDFYAKDEYNNLNLSIEGLKEIISSLSGLPGRKALLYVSDGIPMVAGADLYHLLDLRFGQNTRGQLLAQRYSARNRFQELVAAANASRVTLYTLEATGLRSHDSISAESRGSGQGGSLIEVDVTRDFNQQEPLQVMALDTGGLAALSTNDVDGALARMGKDFRTYYSLGYEPAHDGDGRRHDIEVRVAGRGLDVRHRTSYRDQGREARMIQSVLAALRHGWGVNPLDLRLELGTAQARDDGNFLVPLNVHVPFRRVTLLPRDDLRQGRLQVALSVIDEEGDTSPPQTATLPLTVPAAALADVLQQDVVYTVELLMRRGLHQVAVGVRDDMSGELAVVRQAFQVGR